MWYYYVKITEKKSAEKVGKIANIGRKINFK
jgi:hypothetical protein